MSERNEKDFKKFMNAHEAVPHSLDEKINARVRSDLKLLPWNVFAKTLAIHWGAGALTLLVCPQFGWNPFSSSPHLPHVFMEYGMWACGLFCGSLFMTFGAILSIIFMPLSDKRYLLAHGGRYALSVSALTMGGLMAMGYASSGLDIYFSASFISFWLLGAFVFDWLSFKGFSLWSNRATV